MDDLSQLFTPGHLDPAFLGQYNGASVVICAIVFIVLEILFVTLRFISRKMMNTPWGWDDTFIVASAILCFALLGLSLGVY
jgi:hypothetical protein